MMALIILLISFGIFFIIHQVVYYKMLFYWKKNNPVFLAKIVANPEAFPIFMIPKTLSNLYVFDIKREKNPILKKYKIITTITMLGAMASLLAIILFL